MINKLDLINEKYNELEKELLLPENASDYNKINKLNKEKASLEEIVLTYKEYKKNEDEINSLKEMLNDSEMVEIAQTELEQLEKNKNIITSKLKTLLIPKDENDGKNIIMEIRGAAGGHEANIFAGDLFRMYSKYADNNNWKTEIIHEIEGTSGGYSHIEFSIKGDNVYSKLKYENGVHRVQRVPETETQGRIHTSTATVAVMPKIEDVEVNIKQEELRIDVYRSSGKGGQGVNTTDSAVRITHIPSGIVVTCQKERSQIKNKDTALKILKIKLYDLALQKQEKEHDESRKSKIGTGDRSEKIRTYNYPTNRITDHRINYSIMELDRVMNGNLNPIIDALTTEDLKRKMETKNG